MLKNLFRQPTPDELFKKWRSAIRTQERTLDRQIKGLDGEERKAKLSLKQVAKRQDVGSARVLAKALVRTRKHRDRLHTSKAQLNSILMQLQHQTAMAKMSGTLQRSAEVMKLVNNLVKLPEINAAMMELSKELMKTGIIEEMIEDTVSGLDEEDLEEEAEDEVNNVLYEITNGQLGEIKIGTTAPEITPQPIEAEAEEQGGEQEWDDMRARLSALKS